MRAPSILQHPPATASGSIVLACFPKLYKKPPCLRQNQTYNLGGPKRPLKLTSMHFTSEDERGGSGSRGGPRQIVMGLSAGAGNGGSGGGGHGGSNGRTNLGGGGAEKSGATTLATLDVGARVSPASPYGKSVSLPAGGSGIGIIGGRFER